MPAVSRRQRHPQHGRGWRTVPGRDKFGNIMPARPERAPRPEAPRYLLNSRKDKPWQAAIRKRNKEKSPFLSLPNEIRNKIYDELFCDKNIHIFVTEEPQPWGKIVRHAVCGASSGTDRPFEQAKSGTPVPRPAPGAFQPRVPIPSFDDQDHILASRDMLPVSLLRVCRHIHTDAALLPFKRNTFFFQHIDEVVLFLQKLALKQSAGIKNIVLDYLRGRSLYDFQPVSPSSWVSAARNPASWRMILKVGLPGVRHLCVRYGVSRAYIVLLGAALTWSCMENVVTQVDNLLDFEVLALDAATIRVIEETHSPGIRGMHRQRDWEDLIEKKLLNNLRRSERLRDLEKRKHEEEMARDLMRLRKP